MDKIDSYTAHTISNFENSLTDYSIILMFMLSVIYIRTMYFVFIYLILTLELIQEHSMIIAIGHIFKLTLQVLAKGPVTITSHKHDSESCMNLGFIP